MARFTAYQTPGFAGYLVDVQSDFLSGLNTRVVIPLQRTEDVPRSIPRLNPLLDVNGQTLMLVPQHMGAVSKGILKDKVADLSDQADAITMAVDFLMQGF